MADRGQHRLANSPKGPITAIHFAPTIDVLATCSFDEAVRLHRCSGSDSSLVNEYRHDAPVLDVCWAHNTQVFSGGADRHIKGLEVERGHVVTLGSHNDAVAAVRFRQHGGLISGSWDKTVKLWDSRGPAVSVSTIDVPGAVLGLDCIGHRVVVTMACRYIYVYDVRNLKKPEQRRESSLMHQISCVRCFPEGDGFAISSLEGRVAIEWFDVDPEVQRTQKYAFRCTKQPMDDTTYPVHALAFFPRYRTFATGGADGFVHLWNGAARKRLFQLRKFPSTITSLSFNHDGSLLAVAANGAPKAGESASNGQCAMPSAEKCSSHAVYIRSIVDEDMQSKR